LTAPATLPPRASYGSEFRVDFFDRSGRFRLSKAVEHAKQVQPLPFAQPIRARGIVGHRITDDVALRLPKA